MIMVRAVSVSEKNGSMATVTVKSVKTVRLIDRTVT